MRLNLSLDGSANKFIGALFFLAPLVSIACEPRTELETVYCQLHHKYSQLPSLEDFRRNSTKVQRLLLRRPAQESGVKLPPKSNPIAIESPEGEKPPVPKSANSLALKSSSSRLSNPKALASKSSAASANSQSLSKALSSNNCSLSRRSIVCGTEVYTLVDNQGNQKLFAGSLGPDNQLRFPESEGTSEARYWSDSYQHYIEKMLSIGLGASTMSYTKFVYTWQESQLQGQIPQARFSAMFEYLKRDKRALAVKASYDDMTPASISWCQSLSHQLWVCDNGRRNWVYQLSKR